MALLTLFYQSHIGCRSQAFQVSDQGASVAPFAPNLIPNFMQMILIYLDPDHHVQVTLRILFNDIPDVVGLSRLEITFTIYLLHNKSM